MGWVAASKASNPQAMKRRNSHLRRQYRQPAQWRHMPTLTTCISAMTTTAASNEMRADVHSSYT